MRILVDMNLSPKWVDFLASGEVEAVHWSNVGADDAPDQDVMRWAADHDHFVLTADLDFGAILAATQQRRPSVIQLRADNLAVSAIGDAVVSAMRVAANELDDGAVVPVDPLRARVRVLPFDR